MHMSSAGGLQTCSEGEFRGRTGLLLYVWLPPGVTHIGERESHAWLLTFLRVQEAKRRSHWPAACISGSQPLCFCANAHSSEGRRWLMGSCDVVASSTMCWL